MSKRVALKDHVLVDTQDLSNFARSVRFASEHERIAVSGFSASGANEYLPGPTEQSLTVEFFGAYGAAETHAILYPLHKNRTVFPVEWRPDQTNPVSATNPQLEGNVTLYSYGPGATRGDVDTFEAVFQAADSAGLAFVTA